MLYKPSQYNVYIFENNNYCVSNTLTCSVVTLNKNEFDALKNNNLTNFNAREIHTLLEQGIIVDNNLDELALLRHTYFNAKNNNCEAHITICPTMECNFSCPYCYEKREKGYMKKEVEDKIINFCKDLIDSGVKKLYILWYGGEPLLFSGIVYRLSKQIKCICQEYNVELVISMISNGYLVDKFVDQLNELNFHRIQITIDGKKEVHDTRRYLKNGEGTFDKIIDNIYKIPKTTQVTIRVNIDHTNIEAYRDVQKIFKECTNVDCYCAPVTIEDIQEDYVKERCFGLDEYQEFYLDTQSSLDVSFACGVKCCSAEMKNTYVIDPNGNVFKCLNDLGNADDCLGNLNNVHKLSNPRIIAKYLGRDPFSEPECKQCEFLPQCYGGCVWVYKKNNSHACKNTKHLFLQKIKQEYMNKEV